MLRRNPPTGRRDYRERLDGRPTESAQRTVGYPSSCTLRSGMSAGDPCGVAASMAAPDGKGLASRWIDAQATSRASGIRISGRPRLSSWSVGEDGRGAFGSLTWGLALGVPQSWAKASTNHQCGLKRRSDSVSPGGGLGGGMLARATTPTEASCLTQQPAQPARPAGAPTTSGGSSDSAGTTACPIGGARPLDAGRFHGPMRQGRTFSHGNGVGGASDSAPIRRWCRSSSRICAFHRTRRIAADGRRHDVTEFLLVVGWWAEWDQTAHSIQTTRGVSFRT